MQEKNKRDKTISLRLSEREKDYFTQLSREQGITVSELIIKSVYQAQVIDMTTLKELVASLKKEAYSLEPELRRNLWQSINVWLQTHL